MTSKGIPIIGHGVNVAAVRQQSDQWQFLLVERANKETYKGFWGFVSGSIERGETVAQVALRELLEETSLRPQALYATEYLIQFFEPTAEAIWILPLLVAVVDIDAEVRLCQENSAYVWVGPAEARKLLRWKNVIRAIDDLSDDLAQYPAPNWVQLDM